MDWESSLDATDDVDERKEEGEPELRWKGKPKLALLLLLAGEIATTSGRAGKGGS